MTCTTNADLVLAACSQHLEAPPGGLVRARTLATVHRLPSFSEVFFRFQEIFGKTEFMRKKSNFEPGADP